MQNFEPISLVRAAASAWLDKIEVGNREFYATWGPIAADDLLAQSGHVWHEPQRVT
jgi:hypothetical protein